MGQIRSVALDILKKKERKKEGRKGREKERERVSTCQGSSIG